LPYYKGENTVFDISPSSLPVSVEHGHMTISQKFQVMLDIASHLCLICRSFGKSSLLQDDRK